MSAPLIDLQGSVLVSRKEAMSTKLHDTEKMKQSHRFRLITIGRLIGAIDSGTAKQQLKDLVRVDHLENESLDDAIESLLASGDLEEDQLVKIHEFTGLITSKAEAVLDERIGPPAPHLPTVRASQADPDSDVASRLAAPPNARVRKTDSESGSHPASKDSSDDLVSAYRKKSRTSSSSNKRSSTGGRDRSRSRKSDRVDPLLDHSWEESWDSKLIRFLRHAPERGLRAVPPLSVKVWDWCRANPKVAWPAIAAGIVLLFSPMIVSLFSGSNRPAQLAKAPSPAESGTEAALPLPDRDTGVEEAPPEVSLLNGPPGETKGSSSSPPFSAGSDPVSEQTTGAIVTPELPSDATAVSPPRAEFSDVVDAEKPAFQPQPNESQTSKSQTASEVSPSQNLPSPTTDLGDSGISSSEVVEAVNSRVSVGETAPSEATSAVESASNSDRLRNLISPPIAPAASPSPEVASPSPEVALDNDPETAAEDSVASNDPAPAEIIADAAATEIAESLPPEPSVLP
ncbi:MAG: hypothetical protein AAGG44_11320, partial [Planctomycetota bacterium]